jgi:hypothetical protein
MFAPEHSLPHFFNLLKEIIVNLIVMGWDTSSLLLYTALLDTGILHQLKGSGKIP